MWINSTLKNEAFIVNTQSKILCRISVWIEIAFGASWCCVCFIFSAKEVDWEVELAFVIGRRGKHIKVSITTSPLRVTIFWCFGEASRDSRSGGRRPLLRGRVHCGQWRQRTRLADEAQREAVAAGKNLWQLLSAGPCISNNRRCERWYKERPRTKDTFS